MKAFFSGLLNVLAFLSTAMTVILLIYGFFTGDPDSTRQVRDIAIIFGGVAVISIFYYIFKGVGVSK